MITIILCVIVGYIILSYYWEYRKYKKYKGCGLDTLALVFAPLLFPYTVKDGIKRLWHRVFS